MRRVLIIGHPGAGKSALAVRLGEILDRPVIHLDRHFWQPGWQATPRDEWRRRVEQMVAEETWIIDGTYDSSLDIRLPRTDTVIFLDFPRWICMWRIIKRVLFGFGQVRPDMGEGCPERVDWSFIKWVWQYRKRHRPRIIDALDEYARGKTIIRLLSPGDVRGFVQRMGGA